MGRRAHPWGNPPNAWGILHEWSICKAEGPLSGGRLPGLSPEAYGEPFDWILSQISPVCLSTREGADS